MRRWLAGGARSRARLQRERKGAACCAPRLATPPHLLLSCRVRSDLHAPDVSWFFLYGTDEYKKVASALEAKTEKREPA